MWPFYGAFHAGVFLEIALSVASHWRTHVRKGISETSIPTLALAQVTTKKLPAGRAPTLWSPFYLVQIHHNNSYYRMSLITGKSWFITSGNLIYHKDNSYSTVLCVLSTSSIMRKYKSEWKKNIITFSSLFPAHPLMVTHRLQFDYRTIQFRQQTKWPNRQTRARAPPRANDKSRGEKKHTHAHTKFAGPFNLNGLCVL